MAERPVPCPELARVLARFPGDAASIRDLFMADLSFRSACCDYLLACEGLAKFEAIPASGHRAEIEEYRILVRELEAELRSMFNPPASAVMPGGTASNPRI